MRIRVNEHIVLKELSRGDAADIFHAINTQRSYLGAWLPFVAYTRELADTEAFVESVMDTPEENREYVFVIRYDGEFAGIIGFKDTDKINRKTEIGYWLSEHFQKKGIITLSVKQLLQLAFEELNINRVQIRCAVGNKSSSNIPRRLGFKQEGIEREGELLNNGEFADLEIFSMLKSEYQDS
ncbi:MAG: GNAT family N-acetyltransferase [Bacteroidales bacterium]|nr:GNAT family N-acetyltransferase [Bacteroidales bacterium]